MKAPPYTFIVVAMLAWRIDFCCTPSGTPVSSSQAFAQAFDSLNTVVFSQSLASAEGKNTRIVRTNLQDEILKLKREPGKNILVGGVDIPSQLIKLGLVDEFRPFYR
jgi:dihydrofolate reductase